MIHFESIIKRSFNVVKNNRYLWFLGLLAGGVSFGANNFSSIWNQGGGAGNIQKFKDLVPNNGTVVSLARAEVKDMGQVLGSSIGPSSVGNVYLWVLLLILAIAVLLALIYVSLTARGALIKSTAALDEGEKVSLAKAWGMGHTLFWRRFSFSILWVLIIILPVLILSIPVIALAIFEVKVLAALLGILFGLAYIVYVIYLALVYPIAERTLFLQSKSAGKSIALGREFFNANWKNFVLTYLILFGFSIGLGIVLLIFMFAVGLPLAGIGFLFYTLAHFLGIAFWIIFGLIMVIALLAISGIFNSFFSSIVTLAYKDIRARS